MTRSQYERRRAAAAPSEKSCKSRACRSGTTKDDRPGGTRAARPETPPQPTIRGVPHRTRSAIARMNGGPWPLPSGSTRSSPSSGVLEAQSASGRASSTRAHCWAPTSHRRGAAILHFLVGLTRRRCRLGAQLARHGCARHARVNENFSVCVHHKQLRAAGHDVLAREGERRRRRGVHVGEADVESDTLPASSIRAVNTAAPHAAAQTRSPRQPSRPSHRSPASEAARRTCRPSMSRALRLAWSTRRRRAFCNFAKRARRTERAIPERAHARSSSGCRRRRR